ncbi:LytTR family DNA-binding domain-containing protein [Winogradskyella maritima]|uniref:LytR/AlgR family response regulator transcription factor n=1 Tax=Winogradskyella maritima TaxID=1517766 RepID=A0ABV8AHP1_9FLAO|nr:LytTR family DNA-binding domain-containing protein [Winogradskyella maritima]
MNVLIIDDDKRICKLIQSLLKRYFESTFKIIDGVTSLEAGIESIKNNDYQLLILDIHLGNNATSFDILKKTEPNNAKIIFITGHENYAIEAIKKGALDYVLKPIQTQEFKEAIEKAINAINTNSSTEKASSFIAKQNNSLMLKDLEGMRLVQLSDIIFLKASGPYTDVFLVNSERITVTKHLKDFENKLNNTGFYRVHNSYIINTLKMTGITKRDGLCVNLESGENIVISGRRKDDFLKFIETHLHV